MLEGKVLTTGPWEAPKEAPTIPFHNKKLLASLYLLIVQISLNLLRTLLQYFMMKSFKYTAVLKFIVSDQLSLKFYCIFICFIMSLSIHYANIMNLIYKQPLDLFQIILSMIF